MAAVPEVIPNPDPSKLTTEQLLRVSTSSEAVFGARLEGVRQAFASRLDGMDKAIELIQRTVDRSPSIAELNAKFEEKFNSIQTQFAERDTRTEQTSKDSKVAVDAALQAAKEAVGEQNKSSALAIAKSEAATTKQIEQMGALFTTTTGGLSDKIDDLKDRVTAAEANKKGGHDVWGYVFGGVGLLFGVVVGIIAIVTFLERVPK